MVTQLTVKIGYLIVLSEIYLTYACIPFRQQTVRTHYIISSDIYMEIKGMHEIEIVHIETHQQHL